ncbi:QueC-like queuosine biosynthesis protein [Pseudomonas phage vB_PpuM-Voja-6]
MNVQNRTRIAVLVGGGLDSHAYMVLKADQPQTDFIHVDYGQRVAVAERNAVLQMAEKLGIARSRVYTLICNKKNHMRKVNDGVGVLFGTGPVEMDNAFVKGRNLFLIQKAIELGYGHVHLTLTQERGRMFPDADLAFVQLVDNLMHRSYDVRVSAPYIMEDKHRVMFKAYRHCPEFLDMSFTCWVGPYVECGTCPHCVKKEKIRAEMIVEKADYDLNKDEREAQWKQVKAGYGDALKPAETINATVSVAKGEFK